MSDFSSPDYGTTPTYAPPGGGEALFAEKRTPRWAVWLVAAVLGIMVIFSTTVGIVFGILNEQPQHIILTGTMLCLTALILIMWRLHAVGDQDPKMLWVLVGMIIVLILTCITINTYVWPEPPAPCEPHPNCPNGLYNTGLKQCVLNGITACYNIGKCPFVPSVTIPGPVSCCNCTTPCAPPAPPTSPSPVNFFGQM